MKVYIHCEDPVVTMVIIWQDDKQGTVADLINIFQENLKKRGLTSEVLNPTILLVKNSKGREISLSGGIFKVVKHMDDLFVEKRKKSKVLDDMTKGVTTKTKAMSISQESTGSQHDEAEGFLNAATIHIGNQRYRKAIEIYTNLLKKSPHHRQALVGIVSCYLKADRPRDAFKHVRSVLAQDDNDIDFLFFAGQCCVAMKDGEGAVQYLLKHCRLMRKQGGAKLEAKQDVQVLVAKAYLLQEQKDMAITILQGVLRENLNHHEALVEYASLLYPLGPGQAEEAMTILLSAVAKFQSDRNAKEKFAQVFTSANGMELLRSAAPDVFKDAKSLFFLASCLKDCSAIPEAITLQKEAMKLEPSNPGIALAYLHNLELLDSCKEMTQLIRSYFKSNPAVGIGTLTCSVLEPYLDVITDNFELQPNMTIPESPPKIDPPKRKYMEDENQWLAFVFTCIKTFFVKGLLVIIPPILELVRPLCQGRELHKSIIRNEAAYFTCIDETLATFSELPSTLPDSTNRIYFIGDSHCVPAAWHSVSVQGEEYTIHPILSTGTKLWHLRPDSTFYPKLNFSSAIKSIPAGSLVTVCLGEIDCRESLLVCWEKARYDTVEDAMDALVSIYLQVLKSLVAKHQWKVYIHPVLPVLDITRPIVMQFNRILASRLVKETSLHWLNFVNDLLTSDGSSLKEGYKLDGTHINPSYLRLFSESLNKVMGN